MFELTARQAQALAWIRTYHQVNGYSPTLREICKGLGIASTNGAADLLVALQRKGALTRGKGRSRAITLTATAEAATTRLLGDAEAMDRIAGALRAWHRTGDSALFAEDLARFVRLSGRDLPEDL